MSPAHDLMERLAAADPVRDSATPSPEQQRDADALLERLLATPAEQRPRTRRRLPALAAATAIAAVAVFAALSVFDSDEGPAPHVVAKAVAALTQDDVIYHYQAIAHATASDVPQVAKKEYFFESWHTTNGRMHRRSYAAKDGAKGRLYEDFAGRRRPGRLGGPALRYDAIADTIYESGFGTAPGGGGAPGFDPFDPSRSLRELEGEGRLRSEGRVEVDGKEAYRLVSGPVRSSVGGPKGVEHVEVLVDFDTYLPLSQRYSVRYDNGTTRTVYWRFLVYERLPLNDNTRSLLDLDPHPGAKCSPFAGENPRGPVGFPNPCRGR
jgi:hypothetical protein